MDSYITEPGDDYENLPESYVIFVTENDVWKGNLPVYTANRKIEELNNVSFNDESHILFVNTAYKGESRLDSLFHDFRCTDPDNMKNEILAARVRYFKESDEGVGSMCQIMEELRDKSFSQGDQNGQKKIIMQLPSEITYRLFHRERPLLSKSVMHRELCLVPTTYIRYVFLICSPRRTHKGKYLIYWYSIFKVRVKRFFPSLYSQVVPLFGPLFL